MGVVLLVVEGEQFEHNIAVYYTALGLHKFIFG